MCRVYSLSSGWFDSTEPSLTTSSQKKQDVKGARALVRGGSSASNLLEPHHHRDSKVCRVLSHEFGVVRLYRTFSTYIYTGETKFAGCLCTSSGWFKSIEPPRTSSNLLEPHLCDDVVREGSKVREGSRMFDALEPPGTSA